MITLTFIRINITQGLAESDKTSVPQVSAQTFL